MSCPHCHTKTTQPNKHEERKQVRSDPPGPSRSKPRYCRSDETALQSSEEGRREAGPPTREQQQPKKKEEKRGQGSNEGAARSATKRQKRINKYNSEIEVENNFSHGMD